MPQATKQPTITIPHQPIEMHAVSRRSIIAALAAVPVAAIPGGAFAAADDPILDTLDWPGALARLERIVRLLDKCHIAEGWTLDREAADRALTYFRRKVSGETLSELEELDEKSFLDFLNFMRSHGQSLDHVFVGEVGGMICKAAAHSPRLATMRDAELIRLEGEFHAKHELWDVADEWG